MKIVLDKTVKVYIQIQISKVHKIDVPSVLKIDTFIWNRIQPFFLKSSLKAP